jgi:hypothetical protein
MATDAYAKIDDKNIVIQIIMADDIETAQSILGDDAKLIEDWAMVGWSYDAESNTYSDTDAAEHPSYPVGYANPV